MGFSVTDRERDGKQKAGANGEGARGVREVVCLLRMGRLCCRGIIFGFARPVLVEGVSRVAEGDEKGRKGRKER